STAACPARGRASLSGLYLGLAYPKRAAAGRGDKVRGKVAIDAMRVATWNVNSLKARLEKVLWWLERASPDVLLMQETKLGDGDVPRDELARAGYQLVHHGVGGANGVAIAARGALTDVITNLGLPLDAPATEEAPDDQPLREPRMVSAVCGGIRFVSI